MIRICKNCGGEHFGGSECSKSKQQLDLKALTELAELGIIDPLTSYEVMVASDKKPATKKKSIDWSLIAKELGD